jgi:hypothetical protein
MTIIVKAFANADDVLIAWQPDQWPDDWVGFQWRNDTNHAARKLNVVVEGCAGAGRGISYSTLARSSTQQGFPVPPLTSMRSCRSPQVVALPNRFHTHNEVCASRSTVHQGRRRLP